MRLLPRAANAFVLPCVSCLSSVCSSPRLSLRFPLIVAFLCFQITKSHPIHARNENSKKRRKAKMPEPPPAPVGAAAKKGGKAKDDKKTDSKASDGKKEGKTGDSKKDGKSGDSKKEGKTGDGSKSKGSFSVPSSSSKSSTSLPAAPAPKPTVALLVRSSLPPAAKAAASVAKSASGGAGPTSPSSKSGGIGAPGGGSGSGGVPVKVLSKSWSAAAAGLKDAAAAAVGAVSSSSSSGGGGSGGSGPVNAWSSSPGIVSGPSKGKASESKAEKVSSPKDSSLQQDASTGGKASDKPGAGGAGGEEKSRKDKAGSKAASQEGEGKAESGSGGGSGKGSQSRQKKKGKEQSVPAPAVPAPVTAAVPANSVWKAKPAALLLRPEAGKAQAPSQQQAQQQKQPPQQQEQQPQQQEQQQQGKQAGRATTESQGKSNTTVTSSSVPPPIKTTTTVSPDPPAPSSSHLPSSTSLSVWTKESSSLHSTSLHSSSPSSLHSSLHPAPPSSSSSSSSTPTECEFSTTSGLSSPPSSFPSTPRAMASLSPSASMGSCADHLPAEPVTEPASSPAEPAGEPSVVGSEAPLSGEGSGSGRAVGDVGVQERLREKADLQVQQQQQSQQQQQQQQQPQQQPRDKLVVAESVAAAAGEASKGRNASNLGMGSVSIDAGAAAGTTAGVSADNAAASLGATAASGAADMSGAAAGGNTASGGLRPWSDACRFALETNRRRVYVRQLQELGFPLGEAAQAVLVHGGDLGGCLNHLLVYHECSCRPSALSALTPSPFVDISLELQALSEIMSAGSLPQDLLEHALVLASGDISYALHLVISHPHGLPSSLPSTQPFPFYSSPVPSTTTNTATTTTSSSTHSSLPPPHPFQSNHCIPHQTTAFPVGPSDPVFAHLSRSASPSPSPSPPSPLPEYTIPSPSLVIPLSNTNAGTYSHNPITTLTPTTTSSSSSLQHTSLLSGIWSSSSPNLPSAAHASPAPPPGFGPSLNAAAAPLGNSASFGTLEARSGSPAPNIIPGSGWNYNGLPELKSQQRVEPVGGCEAGRKVYVPESIGRLWGASAGAAAGMAVQDDSQWLYGVNSDRSSGTTSGLSSCSNSSHGYSQYSEEEGLGDSLLLLPGDEEDLFSRILPGLLG
ncbi:unnamed protein product [Closterium sp. NIES-65]|nr:unnamed protein product [Closterium sp. NIES-65]